MNNKKRIISGQSLFEVVVALFIITLVLVSLVSLASKSISNAIYAKTRTQASKYTQEAIEWLRSEKESNFNDFYVKVTSVSVGFMFCLKNLEWTNLGACADNEVLANTLLKREVSFTTSTINGNTIVTANVLTYWSDSKGIHEARSITDFTNNKR